MKKIHLILFTLFLNTALFSCTPTALSELDKNAEDGQECCGNGGDIPPPPPEPETGG